MTWPSSWATARQLRPDALLFAAGRSVGTAGLGLEEAGVQVDGRGRIVVDSQRRTSCPWVFAAGDVIGPSLASVATDQGRQALCGALGLDFSAHVDQIPAAAIYGLPEVACAGKSEDDYTAGAIPYQVGRCELGATPRGLITGQEGLLKLVFHAGTGVLLGVHAIGEIASEITGQAMIHTRRPSRTSSGRPTTPRPTPTATSWPPPTSWPSCTPTSCKPCACPPGPTGSEQAAHWTGTYLESPNAASAIDAFLPLPTGIGPKVALVPSLA